MSLGALFYFRRCVGKNSGVAGGNSTGRQGGFTEMKKKAVTILLCAVLTMCAGCGAAGTGADAVEGTGQDEGEASASAQAAVDYDL